jgi:nicotinamidase-related amidase
MSNLLPKTIPAAGLAALALALTAVGASRHGATDVAEARLSPGPAAARSSAAHQDPEVVGVVHAGGRRDDAPIPRPGMKLQPGRFALVITDPQVDFLHPEGVTWGVVGKSVTENGTVEHLADLFAVAKATGTPVFVSPHYYYPHDHRWKFEGALEALMHGIGMFDRPGPLSLDGFERSGADWLEQYKPYIAGDNVTVVSPHKVYGPETNDLVLQLRKQGIDQIVLAGMSANLCTESHLRELVEQGFEVVVVADATAAAQLPGYDGYEAAFVNFRMIASDVWGTERAVREIRTGQ